MPLFLGSEQLGADLARQILSPNSHRPDPVWLSAQNSSREKRVPQNHCWMYQSDSSTCPPTSASWPLQHADWSSLPRLVLKQRSCSLPRMGVICLSQVDKIPTDPTTWYSMGSASLFCCSGLRISVSAWDYASRGWGLCCRCIPPAF